MSSEKEISESIKSHFSDSEILHAENNLVITKIPKEKIRDVVTYAKDILGFSQVIYISTVDYPDEKRFEMNYFFNKIGSRVKLWLKTDLDRDSPEIDSITPIWLGANWYEREMYDLFGVNFVGHPDLRRIYLPPDWKGHPLRKDYVQEEDYPWRERVTEYFNPYATENYGGYPLERKSDTEMVIHVGPQHPVLHGCWRLIIKVDGDTITDAIPDVGYIHRGIEKIAEGKRYEQIIPITDRLCYGSSLTWDLVYTMTVEKLMNIEAPPRAVYIRTIMSEIQRITSHLLWLAAFAGDIGTYHSIMLYALREREKFLDILEAVTGARLTYNFARIGGVIDDIKPSVVQKIKDTLKDFRKRLHEYMDMLDSAELFHMRTRGVGVLKGQQAIEVGATGPCLRGAGIEYDVRKNDPYLLYEEVDFKIPVYKDGDVYSRYAVRRDEMIESMHIIEQLIDKMPDGPYRIKVPPRAMRPTGEAFFHMEDPRGESAVFIVGKGTDKPYRVSFRSPAFTNISTLPYMMRGSRIADMAAIIGSIDLCMGEADK